MDLPRLPLPNLNETLDKFLQTVEPLVTQEFFAKTHDEVTKFRDTGKALQKFLRDLAETEENWLTEMYVKATYLGVRKPVTVWSSPISVWPRRKFHSELDHRKFAAKVISGALEYKRMVAENEIPVDYLGSARLDMQQYAKMFGTCRIPDETTDTLVYKSESKHIILIIANQFFKVPVYDGNQVLSEDQILAQIKLCVGDGEPPIGLLTSDNRVNWAKSYKELMSVNKESIEVIQSAIFTVSLDRCQGGTDKTVTACEQLMHGGGSKLNSGNRWFDKTIQFIISEDGVNGLTYEHSPVEGIAVTKMGDFILSYVDQAVQQVHVDHVEPPTKLKFTVSQDIQRGLSVAASNVDELARDLDMNYLHFTKYGKNFIKGRCLSPDSFIQMAIQLTFYKIHGVAAAHYEAATLRKFLHGRTASIRSCSNESVAFAKSMCGLRFSNEEKYQKLLTAIESHKKYALAVLDGFGVDRHLLALRLVAEANGFAMPGLFNDEGFMKSSHWKVMSSHVPSKFDVFMCFGSRASDGITCCYNPRDDNMWFGISSFHSEPATTSEGFKDCLEESLIEMHDLLKSVE